jgi:Protein of unknown function (DUF2846)
MTRRYGLFLLALTLIGSGAWADSPGSAPLLAATPEEVPSFPGPSPALGRIYIYRDVGNSLHPAWAAVRFNGAKIGAAAPGTFFHRDVEPGTYTVSVDSDVPYDDQSKTVTVGPNGVTFVRVYVVNGYGITFAGRTAYIPDVFGDNLVDSAVARREMARLNPAD